MNRNRKLWKYRDKIDGALQRAMIQSKKRKRKIPVIFTMIRKLSQSQLNQIRRNLGCQQLSMNNKLKLIHGISARLSPLQIQKLCLEQCVKRVYMDRKLMHDLHIASTAVGSRWVQLNGLTGKGVGIAIIDTGIHPHPDLTKPTQRIIAFKDFVNHRKKAYDDNGHGTHVAGIAAGNGKMSKGRYRGQAPKAHLVGIKVLDRSGSGRTSNVIRGIEWAVKHRKRYRIRVLNISAGYHGKTRCSNDILCQAAAKAWRDGMVVVAAASNEGPNPRTIGIPGSHPSIITVGAVNDRKTVQQSDDRVARFSGRGAAGFHLKPDLVAPGVGIKSLRVPRGYQSLLGTSMVAPIVSGAVALLLQRYPKLKPIQVKRLLTKHAYKLKANRNAQGAGKLNLRFLYKRRARI